MATTAMLVDAPRFQSTSQIAAEKRALLARNNALERQTSYVYTPPSHRLLYRGSLFITGSRLLLEGLTFTIPINNTRSPSIHLLENTLALALESMRGRALSLSGTTRMDAVHLDKSGEVVMDIHPAAFLSRLYFENQLCSAPITSADGATDLGVRVTLGDPDDEDSSEILIYGRLPEFSTALPPRPSTSSPTGLTVHPTLQLLVARIIPAPPPLAVRLPRPDDPSPRFPPLISFGKKRRLDTIEEDMGGDGREGVLLKRQKSMGGKVRPLSRSATLEDPMLKRAREIMAHRPGSFGDASGSQPLSRAKSFNRAKSLRDDDVFKVPSLPSSAGRSEVPKSAEGKGETNDLHRTNKNTVKRAATDCLSTFGIAKTHPEFKELWGFIYRGTEFALRLHMQTRLVDSVVVDPVVRAHAEMYVPKTLTGRNDHRGAQRSGAG